MHLQVFKYSIIQFGEKSNYIKKKWVYSSIPKVINYSSYKYIPAISRFKKNTGTTAVNLV